MKMYWRTLKAEGLKLKRHPLLLVHLLSPLAAIVIFLGYYTYTPFSPESKVEAYLQVLAVALPLMIGIACAMAADQESAAGSCQQLLTLPSRLIPLVGKLSILLLLGGSSILLAATGFGIGYIYLLEQSPYTMLFYIQAALILFGSCCFLYGLHLLVSLRFGKAASIGLGVVGSLLAALLLTGLGDLIWIYLPFAWPARFVTSWMQYREANAGELLDQLLCRQGVLSCISGTGGIMILLGGWFRRWEGTQSLE
ncbi:lantibiotic immunity ABC transporter MutG family permease subunit [Paenibacillus sanguinis]|uniref:lantibiotic immunity ABC transporter MutG family permease subunit n=1 Tax=Paenibacillus sanguinis TaxID=225906 RepID=UPI00037D6153|nr:lantibiotic immunity ABC transporter MutG family permease subunit [Paenibacillus sanguinis]